WSRPTARPTDTRGEDPANAFACTSTARRYDGRSGGDALADNVAGAAGLHGDAVEAVGGLHRALLVADDDQLRLGTELRDQSQEAVEIDVIEGGLDLVHHVERARPGAEHREQVGQRGQRPLATGPQRQLAHVLARGRGLDLDARVQQVVGLRETKPSLATGEERL